MIIYQNWKFLLIKDCIWMYVYCFWTKNFGSHSFNEALKWLVQCFLQTQNEKCWQRMVNSSYFIQTELKWLVQCFGQFIYMGWKTAVPFNHEYCTSFMHWVGDMRFNCRLFWELYSSFFVKPENNFWSGSFWKVYATWMGNFLQASDCGAIHLLAVLPTGVFKLVLESTSVCVFQKWCRQCHSIFTKKEGMCFGFQFSMLSGMLDQWIRFLCKEL